MKIAHDFPPIYERALAVFKIDDPRGVIFTYGDTIYNPSHARITPHLIEHEKVHARQQGDFPMAWWERYLVDPEFRLQQELDAHRAEYRSWCEIERDRNQRSYLLVQIASRLAGPLYGGIISKSAAIKAVRGIDLPNPGR